MIKEVCMQGNIKMMKKLYDNYLAIDDKSAAFELGGSLIQTCDDQLDNQYIMNIFDNIYVLLKERRDQLKTLLELEGNLESLGVGNKRRLKFVREYKEKFCKGLEESISKFLEQISMAIQKAKNKDKELEAFLQLNYADYKRYLCEATLDPKKKENLIMEVDIDYNDFFTLCDKLNVCLVSSSYMVGHYHYAIFMFEVKNDRDGAIRYLNIQKGRFIDLLDTVFKNFTDSYEIINLITDTLTNWILLNNAEKNKKKLAEEKRELAKQKK